MLYSDYFSKTYNGKHLPDYYPTMYLDGYSPSEVMVAHHRTMKKWLLDMQKEQAQKANISCVRSK